MSNNNRSEKEKEVNGKFEFVVTGGEYSVLHGVLAAADIFVTGGAITQTFIENELGDFGKKVLRLMLDAGINPLTEPIFAGSFSFDNWGFLLGEKVFFPPKTVPYVAARKKGDVRPLPTPPPDVHVDIPIAPDIPVLLLRADGRVYAFTGTRKWQVSDNDHSDRLIMLQLQFSLRPSYTENDFPVGPGLTPAQLRKAFEDFVDSIPG